MSNSRSSTLNPVDSGGLVSLIPNVKPHVRPSNARGKASMMTAQDLNEDYTLVTLRIMKAENKLTFKPPLRPVQGIQLTNFWGGGSNTLVTSCDLVMRSQSYTNIGVPDTHGKGAVTPCSTFSVNYNWQTSGIYPILKLEEYASQTQMEEMTLTVENTSRGSIDFPVILCLKLYH